MLLYMYIAPGQGKTTPWGHMLMSTVSPYHFAHLLRFKTISLKYDLKHILNDFIHVYSPRAGTDNPLGTKVWCQQKFLITLPVFCQFIKNLLKSDFLPFFYFFFLHMYIAPGRGSQPTGDKNLWQQKGLFSLPISCKFQNDLFEIWIYTHF